MPGRKPSRIQDGHTMAKIPGLQTRNCNAGRWQFLLWMGRIRRKRLGRKCRTLCVSITLHTMVPSSCQGGWATGTLDQSLSIPPYIHKCSTIHWQHTCPCIRSTACLLQTAWRRPFQSWSSPESIEVAMSFIPQWPPPLSILQRLVLHRPYRTLPTKFPGRDAGSLHSDEVSLPLLVVPGRTFPQCPVKS